MKITAQTPVPHHDAASPSTVSPPPSGGTSFAHAADSIAIATPAASSQAALGETKTLKEEAAVSSATGPLATFSAAAKNGVTVVIRALGGEQGRDFLPQETEDALDGLEQKYGDAIRRLRVSQGGASIFEGQRIYQVRADLVQKIAQAIGDTAALSRVQDITTAAASRRRWSPAIVDALKSDNFADNVRALLETHRLLERAGQEGGIPADKALRDGIGDAVYSLVQPLFDLFNAHLLEESRPRREEILSNRMEISAENLGSPVRLRFEASAQAINELRAAGGSPELKALQRLILRLGQVLLHLDTPRTLAVLAELLPYGDGVLFDQLAKSDEARKRLIDNLAAETLSRLEQTVAFLQVPASEYPENVQQPFQSGGLHELPGRVHTLGIYAWHADYPFDEVSGSPLLFLGTDAASDLRSVLVDVFAKADATYPSLFAAHKAHFVDKELARWSRFWSDEALKDVPQGEREQYKANRVRLAREQAEDSYTDSETITGHMDVRNLAYQLTRLSAAGSKAFSQSRAADEAMAVFDEVLERVQTPELYRLVADAALHLVRKTDNVNSDARASLVTRLLKPGPASDVHFFASSVLAAIGMVEAVPQVIQALGSDNAEVREVATSTLLKLAMVAGGDASVSSDKGMQAIAVDSVARAGLAKAVSAAVPALEARLDDSASVWMQIQAASALARLGAKSDRAIAMLRELFSPEITPVNFRLSMGVKNASVRASAASALGLWGKASAAALPELEAATTVGKQAEAALKVIEGLRVAYGAQPGKSYYDYEPQTDPQAIAAGKPVLEAAATPKSAAQKALDFLSDPNPPDTSRLTSYSRRDYPLIDSTLHALQEIGKAAEAARDAIRESMVQP